MSGGQFPPMARSQVAPEAQRGSGAQSSRSHNSEAVARAKGGGTGAGLGGKSGLAGQIIPIYGFGILLYILYILFKVRHNGMQVLFKWGNFLTNLNKMLNRKIIF